MKNKWNVLVGGTSSIKASNSPVEEPNADISKLMSNSVSGRTLNVDERKDGCERLVKYVRETFHMHNFYAFKYFICDILNFVNVVGQLFLLNTFFGGVFMAYGTDVLNWSEVDAETRTDPMVRVFPR